MNDLKHQLYVNTNSTSNTELEITKELPPQDTISTVKFSPDSTKLIMSSWDSVKLNNLTRD